MLDLSVSFAFKRVRFLEESLQIHKDLEEVAQISGAPYWRTMWRVFLPLVMPTLVGVWAWSMRHAARQAGTPSILYEGSDN